jgi:branched-chain amino acid transport system substrate-binding protein
MNRRDLVLGGSALLATGYALPTWAQQPVIKFGQSASLTGGQAAYGKDVRDGIAAAFAAGARSDPKAPRLELVSLDDGGDKAKCKANVKTLIDQGVVSLVGLTSGAAAETVLQMVEEARIVMLGTASGNMGIRSDKTTMAYHVRAGYDDEYRRMIQYVKDFNMQRVGYVYLEDTSAANQNAMKAALDHVGLKLTISIPLSRNAKSFDAEVEKLLAARLDCVLFTTNASPVAAIVDKMAAAKYAGFYFSSSFAGQALIDDMAGKGMSIIMSQVVPRPNQVAAGVVKRCIDDLAAYDKNIKIGFTSLEGYIAGRVATEAAKLATKGGAVTRARFKDALSDLNVDLGGYRARFTPPSLTGSHFVDVVAIDRTGRIIG